MSYPPKTRGDQTWLLELLPPAEYKGPHPLRDVFASAVDSLPPEDRLVIEAWAWEGLSLSEIAKRLGLGAKQSAHYRLNRALGLLKIALATRGVDLDNERTDN